MSEQHVTLVEPGTIRLERLLPGPVERAWSYLVEGDKRAKWLCGGEWELRVGGKVVMEFDNARLSADKGAPGETRGKHTGGGVVTRYEPMRLIAHTWALNVGDTEVSYELTPQGSNVLLTIVHRRLDGRDLVLNVMGGWDVHTGILEDVLAGREPRPFWKEHARLVKDYEAAL
jgi:uncharacterized protein YndB with AHSA1/START domain